MYYYAYDAYYYAYSAYYYAWCAYYSKRFATPADPLRPMDVCMFRNIDVQLL